MDLQYSETQSAIQANARRFFENRLGSPVGRDEGRAAYVDQLWGEVAGLGWTGFGVPASAGGEAGAFLDQCVLLEEFGRALVPLPYRAVSVDAAKLIEHSDSEALRRRLLEGIASGRLRAVVAHRDPVVGPGVPPLAALPGTPEGGSVRINGTKILVPDAALADEIIVPVALPYGDDRVLVSLPRDTEGIEIRPIVELSEDEASYEVRFNDVVAGPGQVLCSPRNFETAAGALDAYGTVALCAEMCGAMDELLRLSVEYAQQRVQFGRPIGSFQAVQHLCVEMLEGFEGALHLTHRAAWLLSEQSLETARPHIEMAASWCSDAAGTVAQNGHQVHGAIGFTYEHPVQEYSRRLVVWQGLLGSPERRARGIMVA